jgi:protein-tyrosine kinase
MEHIRQAVELAKAQGISLAQQPASEKPTSSAHMAWARPNVSRDDQSLDLDLDVGHLESRRIISHDVTDRRCKQYDMLRTQVVHIMDRQKWQLIATTSPTPGCGKTLTSINLAMSIARQQGKSVLLVDLDLLRPMVAASLGFKCDAGIIGVLEKRTSLSDAILSVRAGNCRLSVLPCEKSTSHSSEWMASGEMASVLQTIRRDFASHIVILDMPPVLAGDEVISILPQLDCVLLTAAVGVSTVSDIEQCNRHLRSAEVVRVVLNKTPDPKTGYYY